MTSWIVWLVASVIAITLLIVACNSKIVDSLRRDSLIAWASIGSFVTLCVAINSLAQRGCLIGVFVTIVIYLSVLFYGTRRGLQEEWRELKDYVKNRFKKS